MDFFTIIWVLACALIISALDTFDIIYYAICGVFIFFVLRLIGMFF